MPLPAKKSSLHRVSRIRRLSAGTVVLTVVLEVEGPIPATLPGQFYMLRTARGWPVATPRPFSLYDRSPDGGSGAFLIQVLGQGTQALAGREPGDQIWLTGPLGRPFPSDVETPVCVAGGIGLAPFLLLARSHHAMGKAPPRLLFGGRTAAALAGMTDFEGLANIHACTEDGSHGSRGMVTDLLLGLLGSGEVARGETVFGCGPDPMLRAVAAICSERDLDCYLSLETFMACGYGVCNGCSVRVKGERFGGWPYSKCCIEGPVYKSNELVLD